LGGGEFAETNLEPKNGRIGRLLGPAWIPKLEALGESLAAQALKPDGSALLNCDQLKVSPSPAEADYRERPYENKARRRK
jgi:hypothetical protein